jgi:Kef-type K+ transport system membrane component KefB
MYNIQLLAENGWREGLDLLFILGVAVFGGTIGARIFQKLRIPQVVGYIAIGILLGESGVKVIDADLIGSFVPFNLFALGIIGFMIGGELKYDVFKKHGKQFITILLTEGLFAFFIVAVLTTVVVALFGQPWSRSLALGLVLGAIASATAPAATVDVLWEYKTRGILTRTVLAIVALDDGLALLLYGLAGSMAGALLGRPENIGLAHNLLVTLWEITGAVVLGILVGLLFTFAIKYIKATDKILALTIASVLLVMGVSVTLNLESILAVMLFGAALVNLIPRRSRSVFKIVEQFSPPVYVLFFVLVGARLKLSSAPTWVLITAIVYVLGRTAGKMSGSWFGAKLSGAPASIRRYLGLCLFSQAGVAVGLSILAGERFGATIGDAVILIITITTFFVQIIGPPMVKLGVKKAGEVGMNVTEEDLIETHTVADVMDAKTPTIAAGMSLRELVEIVSSTDCFYYPVVDNDMKLIGAVTLDGIRNTFTTQELNDWLVALDIMEPIIDRITPDAPLAEALDRAKRLDIEHLPVVASSEQDTLVGLLNCRAVHRSLIAEVLARQQKADNIHNV